MDQALKEERLAKMIEHVSLDQEIAALQARKLPLHARITELEHMEAREKLNPDRTLDQGIGARGANRG